jgi:uncharacterized protein (DUF58 family)
VTEVPLRWTPSPHLRRLATIALLPLAAAVVLGRAEFLVLAAPATAALAVAARRPGYGVRLWLSVSADRCGEGEELALTIRAQPQGQAWALSAEPRLPAALQVVGDVAEQASGDDRGIERRWVVRAARWGRWENGQVQVTVRSRGGLFTGTAAVSVPLISVFPRLPALTQLALPAELNSRIGDHVDRRPGDGVEFAGVRPFTPGDRLRRINWPVSTRRGTLHVNQLAAERAAEIVAVIDAFTDVGRPGESSLDRAVRGAAGVAWAYARAGDRVGLVTLAGPLRWLEPGPGYRQFYRIAESVLDARGAMSYVAPDLARVPRTALPPGALAIMFTPLLDERAIGAALDLRERGHPVVIADVLADQPEPSRTRTGGLALRLWLLERQALRYRLESAGIPVTGWPGQPSAAAGEAGEPGGGVRVDYTHGMHSLDHALGRFARHRVRGGLP